MEFAELMDSKLFAYVILPLFIFIARVLDVSLQTLRVVFVSKGYKILAPLTGFFEVFIWIIAIGQIMKNLSNIWGYFAYAAGFAAGTVVGLWIEEKLSIGKVGIRIITKKDAEELVEYLREANYGVTALDAIGSTGNVKIIYTIIKRKNIENVVQMIEKYNPHAFYTIEDVRFVAEGIFPQKGINIRRDYLHWLHFRKGK
jgi:uncharacterized protein YebE (UPF0316 family)